MGLIFLIYSPNEINASIANDRTRADLSKVNLEMVAMQGTNLEEATLKGAKTVDTAFSGAFFLNTIAWEGNIVEGPEYFD